MSSPLYSYRDGDLVEVETSDGTWEPGVFSGYSNTGRTILFAKGERRDIPMSVFVRRRKS